VKQGKPITPGNIRPGQKTKTLLPHRAKLGPGAKLKNLDSLSDHGGRGNLG